MFDTSRSVIGIKKTSSWGSIDIHYIPNACLAGAHSCIFESADKLPGLFSNSAHKQTNPQVSALCLLPLRMLTDLETEAVQFKFCVKIATALWAVLQFRIPRTERNFDKARAYVKEVCFFRLERSLNILYLNGTAKGLGERGKRLEFLIVPVMSPVVNLGMNLRYFIALTHRLQSKGSAG